MAIAKFKNRPDASLRRMGPEGSETWHAMLDGAEHVLREEGYAALSSRRIAEQIGVKQRLVYYYFQTMDALIVATFQRLAVREMERLRAAQASARPLRALWDIGLESSDARLVSEFMALAYRIPELQVEVAQFIEQSRSIEAAVIDIVDGENPIAAEGLALIASALALSVTRESRLGITTGHETALQMIEAYIAAAESARSD
jgi:AcrR family transcriptional regulator